MKRNKKRIIKYFLISNIIVLGIITALVFLLPDNKIIESFKLSCSIIKILIIYISVFLPVSAGAVFYVFNLSDKTFFEPGSLNFFLSSLAFIIIPPFIVYSFLVLYLNPVLIEKKIWLENLSETAVKYRTEIFKNRSSDIEKAYIFSSLYLYIDPDNETINNENDDIYIRLLDKKRIKKKETEIVKPSFTPQLLTGKKLIEISEDFLKHNDYSSAIYYSEIAGKFKNTRKNAKNIVNKAESVLKTYPETNYNLQRLYNEKLEIKDLYNKGKYIDSYYKTIEVKKLFPEDKELDTQKTKLIEKLKEISFFYEDIKNLIFVPGKENIIFRENINRQEIIISIGKIVFADNETYLFNINAFYPDTGKSWSAPFGKITGKTINMNCIGREKEKFYRPEIKNSKNQLLSVPISCSGRDLVDFSNDEESIRKISFASLVSKTEILKNNKFGRNTIIIEIAERIIKCTNYIIVLFISVYSGLSFMKRKKRKSRLSLMLFPAVVFVAAASDFFLFNFNKGIFENLISCTSSTIAFILFTLLISAEFGTALFLVIKKSSVKALI